MATEIQDLERVAEEDVENMTAAAARIGEEVVASEKEGMKSMQTNGVFFRQPLASIRSNGLNFFANYKGDGNIFVVEPYVWFLLGIVISIVVLANSGGKNMSSELSWIWIVFGIFIIIVFAKGNHRAEG